MSATVLKDSIEVLSNDFVKRSPERKGKLYKGEKKIFFQKKRYIKN